MVGHVGRGGGNDSGSGTHNDVMYLLYADGGDQTTAMLCSNFAWNTVSSCLNEYIAVATFFFVNAHVLCYAAGDWKSWDTGYWQLDQATIVNCATLLGY